jgi:hypothetical protein
MMQAPDLMLSSASVINVEAIANDNLASLEGDVGRDVTAG